MDGGRRDRTTTAVGRVPSSITAVILVAQVVLPTALILGSTPDQSVQVIAGSLAWVGGLSLTRLAMRRLANGRGSR